MYLYHYTYSEILDSIKIEGLKVGKRLFEVEMMMEEVEKYKPNKFPDFVKLQNAIYFSPKKHKEKYKYIDEEYVIVDANKLNKEKLYVADAIVIDRLWHEVVNVYYHAKSLYGSVEGLSKKYWSRFMAFEDYEKLKYKYKKIEFLYFENIEKNDIIYI